MPTAARLVGSLMFAALAWGVSQLIVPLLPEGMDVGWFAEVNAAVGFLCGWIVAGSRAGNGWGAAISYGLTTAAATLAWALFLHCFAEMVRKSLTKIYDGPAEAVVNVFALMIDYGGMMATPQVLGTLAIGGVVAGLITEVFGRNFR